MTRFITSLANFDRARATPEEAEAYRVSHEALYRRMTQVLNKANETAIRMATPVTDRFGRPLPNSYWR